MILLWLALCSTVSAQEILWTAGPVDPVPKTIIYSSAAAPSATASSVGEVQTKINNFDKRTISLVFGSGAVSGELFWSALTKSEESVLEAGKSQQATVSFHSVETHKLVYKDPQRLEWQQRSFNEVPRAANNPTWDMTVKFLKNAVAASYHATSIGSSEVVISRAGQDEPFYRGPTGLPLVSALAQAHLKDAGEKLSAAERDEIWTAAFLQVFGLPQVVVARFVPEKNVFAISLRGNGLLAADLPIEIISKSPVSVSLAESFGRSLKQAHPTVRLRYANGGVTVREGSFALGENVYRAEVPRPR